MGPKDVIFQLLDATVEKMPQRFFTRDVSEHPDMVAAHPVLSKHSHYHAFVGRRLSMEYRGRALVEIKKKTSRGSLWEKTGGHRPPAGGAAG